MIRDCAQARTLEIYKFLGVEEVPQRAMYTIDILEHAKGSSIVHNVQRMQKWAEPTPSCPWVCPISSERTILMSLFIAERLFDNGSECR